MTILLAVAIGLVIGFALGWGACMLTVLTGDDS